MIYEGNSYEMKIKVKCPVCEDEETIIVSKNSNHNFRCYCCKANYHYEIVGNKVCITLQNHNDTVIGEVIEDGTKAM